MDLDAEGQTEKELSASETLTREKKLKARTGSLKHQLDASGLVPANILELCNCFSIGGGSMIHECFMNQVRLGQGLGKLEFTCEMLVTVPQ